MNKEVTNFFFCDCDHRAVSDLSQNLVSTKFYLLVYRGKKEFFVKLVYFLR